MVTTTPSTTAWSYCTTIARPPAGDSVSGYHDDSLSLYFNSLPTPVLLLAGSRHEHSLATTPRRPPPLTRTFMLGWQKQDGD